MQLTLSWESRYENSNNYIRLDDVDLSDPYFDNLIGVYIIWYPSKLHARTVYAGQGVIRDRLLYHRNNSQIQYYASSNTLCVAFAETSADDMDGIEIFLHNNLEIFVKSRTPAGDSIPVNLPEVGRLVWWVV